ncbi:unnamed protein product [Mycena citricolor]|uniref:Uncharacterized protein n=1 Tax=Mycena citricolor TaxID=2018698 RepID=A0AAD2H5G4_9AGAR|nr:unnamed protein product [Mycena citricolor]
MAMYFAKQSTIPTPSLQPLTLMLDSVPASPLCSPQKSLSDFPDLSSRKTRLRRCKTSSSLFAAKVSLELPTKTDPSVYLTVRGGKTSVGSFSPIPDAQSALRVLAKPARHPVLAWISGPSVAPSPPKLLTAIPSISRTASSSPVSSPTTTAATSLSDYDRNYYHPTKMPTPRATEHSQTTTPCGTPPGLASLERSSRLCTTFVHCATCGTSGSKFPSCGRCGQSWCSRACRLPGGVRHSCAPVSGQPV